MLYGARMDAVFIIDEEYPAFSEAWNDLTKLIELTGASSEMMVEPLRFSLGKTAGKEWLKAKVSPATEIGWHFFAEPKPAFLLQVKVLAASLEQEGVQYRVRGEPLGQPQSIEL